MDVSLPISLVGGQNAVPSGEGLGSTEAGDEQGRVTS